MNDKEKIEMLEKRVKHLEGIIERLCSENNIEMPETEEPFRVLASYDFSKMSDREHWRICNADALISETSLAFDTITVEKIIGFMYDPMLINSSINMPIDDVSTIHVRVKSNVDATKKCMMRVYFTTETSPDWSQKKSMTSVYTAGRLVDVYVDTNNKYWQGNINKLRIDPVEGLNGSVELELIELLDKDGNVKYRYDFTSVEELDNIEWKLRNATFVSCRGKLIFNINVIEKKHVFTDPFIVNCDMELDIKHAKYIHVKLRTDLAESTDKDTYIQVFFTTKSNNKWTQDKSIRYSYKTGEEVDAYIEVRQLFWKGTLTGLRIDPIERLDGRTEIKLVEILSRLPDGCEVETAENRTHRIEDRFNEFAAGKQDGVKDKTVFILLGQSNATGHATPMTEEDKIVTPLKNVYGLQRSENQSFDITDLVWSNYISAGTNLAEEQDDTYSLANCLAKKWQEAVDDGADLPDLYIIQIAIGAEGVTEKYMWYPEREKKLIPGKLGEVDISMYPFALHVFSLLDKSLKGDYDIMGIHWRGGEEETDVRVAHLKEVLRGIYDRMFEGFYSALKMKVPVILHKMASETRCREMNVTGEDVEAMHFINKTFDDLAKDNDNISTFDIKNAPHYDKDAHTKGIFLPDGGHYTPKTNMWVAEEILRQYKRNRNDRT